ncbi:hypothetical protein D3C74_257570 [compost metagenome]
MQADFGGNLRQPQIACFREATQYIQSPLDRAHCQLPVFHPASTLLRFHYMKLGYINYMKEANFRQ